MKIVPTFIHGIFDYVGGIALLLAPELFRFSEVGGAAVLIPRIIGIVIIAQSLITKYEVGAFKILPMRMHLMNDYVASLFLVASPWMFGFANGQLNVWLPHVIAGLGVLALTSITKTVPFQGQGRPSEKRSLSNRKAHA